MRCVASFLCGLTLVALSLVSQVDGDDNNLLSSLLVNQLAILDFINGSSTARVQQQRQQATTMRDDVTTLKAEMAMLKDLMQTLRSEPEASSAEVTSLREDVLAMRKAILIMRDENLAMQTTIAQHEAEQAEHNSVVQRLSQDLDTFNRSLIAQGEEHDLERETIMEAVQNLTHQLESLSNASESCCENVREEQQVIFQSLEATLQHLNASFIQALNSTSSVMRPEKLIAAGVSIAECVEGDLQVNENCSISVCYLGYQRPYQGERAANVRVNELLERDCVRLYTDPVNWSDARDCCKTLGGDLYVAAEPGHLTAVLNAFSESITGLGPWVGARSRKWLDGREIGETEWDINDGQPNGADDHCVNIYPSQYPGDSSGAWDYECAGSRPYMCQLAVSYP